MTGGGANARVGKGAQFAFQFGYIIAIIQAVKLTAMAGAPEALNSMDGWHKTKTVTDSDSTPPTQPGKGTEYAVPISAKL